MRKYHQLKSIHNIYLILIFSFVGQFANAQYKSPIVLNEPDYDVGKKLRFGFSLGLNTMDFTIKNSGTNLYYFDLTHLIPGFNVNAVSDLRLTENFHLRFLPGYAFGQRNINIFEKANDYKKPKYTLKIESSFIDLPLSIKYSAQRVTNVRPYLLAGSNFRIDLAASKKITGPDEEGRDTDYYKLRKGNFYYEIGFGIDFFLTYFKFSTEFKWSVGIGNIISTDPDCPADLQNAIKSMNSQLFILAFHFE